MSLLSLTSVDPRVALNNQVKCKKNLGSFCLDNSSLSVAGAEVIIALGCLFVIVLVSIPCVWLEWRRKSGQASFRLGDANDQRPCADNCHQGPCSPAVTWTCDRSLSCNTAAVQAKFSSSLNAFRTTSGWLSRMQRYVEFPFSA